MFEIEFKYDLGQKIITPHREEGYVSMLAYDHWGRKYYVLSESRATWFREEDLALIHNEK